MATIHLNLTTTATPEQFIAGVTDFGPGRSELFGNSADEYLKVHDQGPGQAEVTEGSGGIWERLHYDWSNPKHRQGHRKSEPRRERGGTHIDAMDPPSRSHSRTPSEVESGVEVNAETAWLHTVSNGLIVHLRSFATWKEALKTAGLRVAQYERFGRKRIA
jgi:hypothetical protein